jgi:hypothetical protein
VAIAAVQFANGILGPGATMFVSWIEDAASEGGSVYQRVYAARVSCAAIGGGG